MQKVLGTKPPCLCWCFIYTPRGTRWFQPQKLRGELNLFIEYFVVAKVAIKNDALVVGSGV